MTNKRRYYYAKLALEYRWCMDSEVPSKEHCPNRVPHDETCTQSARIDTYPATPSTQPQSARLE
eukprot:6212090-Pleurochrysis_carterae.AAC.2